MPIYKSAASKKINRSTLNNTIVQKYYNNKELMRVLDEWVLSPYVADINELISMKTLLSGIQPIRLPKIIYRGFRVNHTNQDQMGFVKKGFLINSIIKPVGSSVEYTFSDKALSFSTDIDISMAFGNIIVTLDTTKYNVSDNCIHFTDELAAALNMYRNLKNFETQKEVIILPTINKIIVTRLI